MKLKSIKNTSKAIYTWRWQNESVFTFETEDGQINDIACQHIRADYWIDGETSTRSCIEKLYDEIIKMPQ